MPELLHSIGTNACEAAGGDHKLMPNRLAAAITIEGPINSLSSRSDISKRPFVAGLKR